MVAASLKEALDMTRTQRFSQYIQSLAYEGLFDKEAREEWPAEVPNRAPESPTNPAWNANAYTGYVPFGEPAKN
jgi:hypothetical protein